MDREEDLNLNDDSEAVVEFYERNLQFLVSCPVYSLLPGVLKDVAALLNSTQFFDSDWQVYASEMGITDHLLLAKIQASAKTAGEMPLYVTMKSAIHQINGNLSNIIKALLKTKRLDVLNYLKPFIEELLNKASSTEAKGYGTDKEQVPGVMEKNSDFSFATSEELSSETISSVCSISTANSDNVFKIDIDPALYEPKACDLNAYQRNLDIRKPSNELKLHSSGVNEFSFEDGSLQKNKFLPSAPEDRLSVLIQHTEFDIEVAQQLSSKLREEGFAVTTLFELEMVTLMDSAGALSTAFQEVDFIVPVVSKNLLEQIYPQDYDNYLESQDAMNNRTLYQLMMTEYRNRRCVNLRVRPVLVPGMNRRMLTKNVILSYSFRLWNELPKLIRVLKETKELIQKLSLS